MQLFSPAKVNLFFRVLNKRPDGFHEIASLYQAISFGDFITFSLHEKKDSLFCNNPAIPVDGSNLILKAAELFRQKTGINQHFSFKLDKKIPIEAGLGEGSSNAATTLWGLNQLLGTAINDKVLAEWGAELGSDVPFFLSKGRAYCQGRGEILSEVPKAAFSRPLWIAKPSDGLSTQAVYREVQLNHLKKWDLEQVLRTHQSQNPIHFNDLEDAAFRLLPNLKAIKTSLQELGFDEVHLTGSGTSFFCFGEITPPNLPSIDFNPAQFLYREEESWYKFPN